MNKRKCNKKRIAWMLVLALFASCLQPVGILAKENVDAEMATVSANAVPVLGMLQLNKTVKTPRDMASDVQVEGSVNTEKVVHFQFKAESTSVYAILLKYSEGYAIQVYEEGSAYGDSANKLRGSGFYQPNYVYGQGGRSYQMTAGKTYEVYVADDMDGGGLDDELTITRVAAKAVYDKDEFDAFIASGGTVSIMDSSAAYDYWDTCDEQEIPYGSKDLQNGTYLILRSDTFKQQYKGKEWTPGFSKSVVCTLDLDTNRTICDGLKDSRYGYWNEQTDEFEVMLPVKYYTENGKELAMDSKVDTSNIILVSYVPAVVFVQKITLTGTTALQVGQKATVKATIDTLNKYTATNPNVTFSTSNASVLKVSAKGEIEGIKAGTADVICKSDDGNAVQKLTVTVKAKEVAGDPKPVQKPTVTPAPQQTATSVPEKKGTTITTKKEKGKFKVTSTDSKNPTVEYVGPTASGKNKKTITIPEYITYNGVKYRVTSVAAKSFKNNKKVTAIKISSSITTIGKSAFEGCIKLKTITMGKGIRTIGKNAFKNCKSLKTITIKSTKLKTVDKSAFKGVNKKCVIKVPKKMLKKYRKLFKKKGIKLKVKAA